MTPFPITSDRVTMRAMPAGDLVRAGFAERLKAARTEQLVNGKPMSKAEFARRLNAEASTTYNDGNVRNWERDQGQAMPNARTLPSIAIVLGVSLDYLMGLSQEWDGVDRRTAGAKAAEELESLADELPAGPPPDPDMPTSQRSRRARKPRP